MNASQTVACILVVDDDDDLRSFMQLSLESEGYEVCVAADGAAALELIHTRGHPEMILLDMRMPVMDGWQFARAYRELSGPHAPIVVVSAATNARSWAGEIGAAGCLPKPFDLLDLLAEVEHFLPERSPGGSS